MAGFREFVTGEVLTAANVDDFLMKQSVQKYADAAARDAALGVTVGGGNALRQGMVAYLDDVDEVIKYDGTVWTTVGNAGIGSNVASTTKTNLFSSSLAGGASTAITGLNCSITPTSSTSKVLVFGHITIGSNQRPLAGYVLKRDSTAISIGDSGEFVRATGGYRLDIFGSDDNEYGFTLAFVHLDFPETVSPVTYSLDALNTRFSSQVIRVNNVVIGNAGATATSTITAIEVAA